MTVTSVMHSEVIVEPTGSWRGQPDGKDLVTVKTARMEINMANTTPEQNKAIVLEAFDTLLNKRDYSAAQRFWSPNYIQHSAHIEPG